jgi:RNA polymerase sigma-70 factor (ECF subfamily)
VRAQRKIVDAGMPYEVPGPADLPARLDAVSRVVYFVFTEGYAATHGDDLVRTDLCAEAIRLAETLAALVPDDAEAHGLVALLHLQHARRHARVDVHGRVVLLEDQDRGRWDRAAMVAGLRALRRAAALPRPGRLVLQAAIANEHTRAPTAAATDWVEILALYDLLQGIEPTPVVALNRAVAVAMVRGPEAGLAALDALGSDPHLERGHLLPAARADLLRRLGRTAEAAQAYRVALDRVTLAPERQLLDARLVEVEGA